MSEYTVPASEAWRFQLPDQCPHCDEGVTFPRDQLDAHIAEVHADLPPCTARISNAGTGDQAVRCRFRVGHRDDSGDYHAGPYDERMGRLRWGDHAMGAIPHQPQPNVESATGIGCAVLHTDGQGNPIPCPGYPHAGSASGGPDRHPALTAKLSATSAEDLLRAAEIRAAIAEHEAEAYRNQVQALVRELLRARDVPEDDLPQKVRVIILNEEAP